MSQRDANRPDSRRDERTAESTNEELRASSPLATHLSAELLALMANAHSWRTRAAYMLWVGPYVILGALITATQGNILDKELSSVAVRLLLAAAGGYLLIGVLAGLVERHYWNQAERLRNAIIEVAGAKDQERLKCVTRDRELVRWWTLPLWYGLVFFLILTPFLVILASSSVKGGVGVPRRVSLDPADSPIAPTPTPKPTT